MGQTTLVARQVFDGERFVQKLGDRALDALWLYDTDTDEWELRVVLEMTRTSKDTRAGYALLRDEFRKLSPPLSFDMTDVRIVSEDDPVIQELRRTSLARSAGVSQTRIGGNRLGNVFIKEAYLYKIASGSTNDQGVGQVDTTDITCPQCGGEINVFTEQKRKRIAEKLVRDDVIGKCRKCNCIVTENFGEYEAVSESVARNIGDMVDDMIDN